MMPVSISSPLTLVFIRTVGRTSKLRNRASAGDHAAAAPPCGIPGSSCIATDPRACGRPPDRDRGRKGLIEERHWEVAEIEKLRFNPLPLLKLLKNPLRRFFRKPVRTCAADDH